MELGFIGLPNSGKTTVFNAITRADVAVSGYSDRKAEPNVANRNPIAIARSTDRIPVIVPPPD